MDVLDSFDEIKVCTEYEVNGERTNVFPLDAKTLESVKPIYKSFKGWKSITRGSTDYQQMPVEARTYLDFIQEEIGVKLKILSTGPGRKETIVMY
jgi:adenylosuccinate synthase